MRILAIIPAFNEEEGLKKVAEQFMDIDHVDVLVVNDCSQDHTSLLARKLGFNVIDLPCNLGIGGAVQTGYKYAWQNGYDIAIQVDGDGQHDPRYITDLITPLLEGDADLVIGSRYLENRGFQSTFMRRIGIQYFSLLIRLVEKKNITDPTSGFRACNRRVIELFSSRYPHDYPEPESIVFLLRKNYHIKEVPVIMNERFGGESSITSFKSVYYMVKVSLAIFIDTLRKIRIS